MKLAIVLIVLVVGLFMVFQATDAESGPRPGSGEPVVLTESEARDVFSGAVVERCRGSIGVTLGMSKVMRTLEMADATRATDRWIFRADGMRSEVYQSGAVTGELADELVSVCNRGNN